MDDNFYMDDFSTDSFREETKLLVKKLTVQCPQEEPLPDCPLSALRELSLVEKLEMVDKMPLDQLENIVRYHDNCLQEREKGEIIG